MSGQAVVGELTGEKLAFVPSDIVPFSIVKEQYPRAKILSTDTGHVRDYASSPYPGYDTSTDVWFPVQKRDERLHPKTLVYGVVVDGQAKAYERSVIESETPIIDHIGSTAISLEYDSDVQRVVVTNRNTGHLISTLPIYWFSWLAQYPETELYVLE